MTRDDATVSERDLLAYVDDELDAGRRAAVEAHLAASPADAATVAEWCRQNETVAALYASGGGARDIPARLDPYELARRKPTRPRFAWPMAAAAVLLLAIGSAGGWYGRDMVAVPGTVQGGPTLADDALAAHNLYASEVVHPVEVRASDRDHLQAWLSKRLDRPLQAPSLHDAGFELVGGRLLPAGTAPAAQFMYEDASGRRVTLYIVPSENGGESALHFERKGRLDAFSWTDERIACAIVGDLPRDRLKALAVSTYKQLS